MKGYSADQVRAAEAPFLAAGVPLMRRAADALADEIARRYSPARVLLLVGSGNNGGDALYAGERLAASGVAVDIAELGSHTHAEGLAAALAAGARIVDDPVRSASAADVVVDGILGTGASGALRGRARTLVELVRPMGPRVVAVDIPSGVDPTTGQTTDDAVLPADVTVTFGGCKAGLLLGRGRELAGEIVLVDIGIDAELERMAPLVETA
jgi:hydroxyethylthiazole kinase-like uncharacterized protein yjeF